MLKTAKNVYKELMEESTVVESFLNNNPVSLVSSNLKTKCATKLYACVPSVGPIV